MAALRWINAGRLRTYAEYASELERNIHEKFRQTVPFVRSGKVGDVGCGTRSWIALAIRHPRCAASEFHGVDVDRQAYEICRERQRSGEFGECNVFFSCKDAATEPVFECESMDTIHTSSVTHEVRSQVPCRDLKSRLLANPSLSIPDACDELGYERLCRFIENRYDELRPGGVWINRDIVGPANGDREVYLELSQTDGRNENWDRTFLPYEQEALAEYLAGLSTYARFLRFARDFRKSSGYRVLYSVETIGNRRLIRVAFCDACEFAMKKDYLRDWRAEMDETFCSWDVAQWTLALRSGGFEVLLESRSFLSRWIVTNRLQGRLRVIWKRRATLEPLPYPPTHLILVAQKPV